MTAFKGKTKRILFCTFLLLIFMLIAPIIYQLEWMRESLEHISDAQSAEILAAYGLTASEHESVRSFSRIYDIDDVYYVIEISGIEHEEEWLQNNAAWEVERLSPLYRIMSNKRFSQQRIYVGKNGKIFVSCFSENKPEVGALFRDYDTENIL